MISIDVWKASMFYYEDSNEMIPPKPEDLLKKGHSLVALSHADLIAKIEEVYEYDGISVDDDIVLLEYRDEHNNTLEDYFIKFEIVVETLTLSP